MDYSNAKTPTEIIEPPIAEMTPPEPVERMPPRPWSIEEAA
jgi:hypothetical protein